MESVTRFVDRQSGALPATSTPVPAATQTLAATASYLLSEDGRKVTGIFGAIFLSSDGQPFWQNFTEMHVEVPLSRILPTAVHAV